MKYYKTKNGTEVVENPFNLLNNKSLVNDKGKIQNFYSCNVKGKALKKLTLSDFVNNGVEFLKNETKDKNEDGYSAQIGSSGDYARIGLSGDSAQINIEGKNSIGFACGINSILCGKKGTWLSLAEWGKDKNGNWIPGFAKSAQIGNKEYKDCFGKILQANTFYQLINKEFTPVIDIDGSRMIKLNSKKLGALTIYKTQYVDDFKQGNKTYQYVAERGEFTAHGKSIKEAVSDVEFKVLQSQDVKEHVKRVKEQGFITPNDYRLLTGACRYGTNRWLEENGYTWEDSMPIDVVIELTKGQYGHDRLLQVLRGDNHERN